MKHSLTVWHRVIPTRRRILFPVHSEHAKEVTQMQTHPRRIWPWIFLIFVIVMVVKAPATAADMANSAAHGASQAADGISRFANHLGHKR